MSFDSIQCNRCELSHWKIPQLYITTENGDIEILMYPRGSIPFEKRYGYAASKAVRIRGNGFIKNFYCMQCQEVSDIADADEKKCRDCASSNVIDLSSVEDKSCPRCKLGIMITRKSPFDF